MDKQHYMEMMENLEELIQDRQLQGRNIYLFGHCNASEVLMGVLRDRGYSVKAILDNNASKQGTYYEGVGIESPETIMKEPEGAAIVCIVARAYESMASQLRTMGYSGEVRKLIDYNSYAEYSLSPETVARKRERLQRGMKRRDEMRKSFPGHFRFLCPFSALGDVYYAMAYLPYFLQKRQIGDYMVAVIGEACAQVVRMFGMEKVAVLQQREMDELIQATLYAEDENAFIPHQDRPYVINLAKALYLKKLTLDEMYRCGVFGLPMDTTPHKPSKIETYGALHEIKKGKAVVLAPGAKSVSNIPECCWRQVIEHYEEKGCQIFTNVIDDEEPLKGTLPLKAPLSQMQSVVECAGTFIGLRSGLCDVLKEADCRKIALYPNQHYSDTRWKMAEIYHLDGWENIVVDQPEIEWKGEGGWRTG